MYQKTILRKALGIVTKTDATCRLAISSLSQWNGKPEDFLQTLSNRHDLEYCHTWAKGDISLMFKLLSELGYIYLWDSLFYKQKDEQTIRYDVSAAVKGSWNVSLNTSAVTPLYKMTAIFLKDSLGQIKGLSGGFLTPMKAIISLGVTKKIDSWGNIYLGLSSLKLVYILNKKVFDLPGTLRYHGIEKGNSWLCEYGISSCIDLRKELTNDLMWELYLQVFLEHHDAVDISLKNLLSLKAGKLLNASIKTSILYDKADPLTFQMENVLTIGFVVNVSK